VARDRRVLTVDTAAADRLVELLGDDLDHGRPDRSFSPFWSNVGLGFADAVGDAAAGFAGGPGAAHAPGAAGGGEPRRSPGIATLYLHYNRVTRALGAPFLEVAGTLRTEERGALAVTQTLADGGRLRVAFGDTDTFLVEVAGVPTARLAFLDDPALERLRVSRGGARRRYDALLPTLDPRDPDRAFPIAIGVRLLQRQLGRTTPSRAGYAPTPTASSASPWAWRSSASTSGATRSGSPAPPGRSTRRSRAHGPGWPMPSAHGRCRSPRRRPPAWRRPPPTPC
jgi:hypothetical protein